MADQPVSPVPSLPQLGSGSVFLGIVPATVMSFTVEGFAAPWAQGMDTVVGGAFWLACAAVVVKGLPAAWRVARDEVHSWRKPIFPTEGSSE